MKVYDMADEGLTHLVGLTSQIETVRKVGKFRYGYFFFFSFFLWPAISVDLVQLLLVPMN